MNFRHLIIAGLCCLAAACGKNPAGGGGFNADCVRNSDCAQPFYCKDGACVLDAASVCQAGVKRCNGDSVETCAEGGDRWDVTKDCATGCSNNDCRPQACTPNERKCDGSMIFQCLSNGSGFVFVQSCPTACNEQTKECSTPICAPYETRCKPDSTGTLQTCNSRGTAWVDSPCSATAGESVCVEGRCLAKTCSVTKDATGAVTTREERCRGTIAEACNDTETGFEAKQVCGNGCDFDAVNKKATCPAAACTPFDTRCKDRGTLQTCNSRGTAWVDAACDADSQRCVAGACIPKACSVTVGSTIERQQRCNGAIREECDDTETKFRTIETCEFGCNLSGTTATCAPAACAEGETTCDGLALMKCAPGRASFGFVQYCPSGCVKDATTTPPSAACAAPSCAPLSRRCGTESLTGISFVETCKADGTGWDRVESCPQACTAGICQVTDSTCVDGDIRCRGYEVEQCVRLSSGSSEWRFVDRCLGQCNSGVCATGGAVGCAGGVIDPSTATCGTSQRLPFQVKAMLADPVNDKVPCDGTSRVLLYTTPIASSSGVIVPDGTLVTFVHDSPAASPDSLLASTDADPVTPGLQRPTLNGVATVVISAPAASSACNTDPTAPRTVKVTASISGKAQGVGQLTFLTPAATTPPQKFIYLADDFSSLRNADRVNSTTAWNTTAGTVTALPSFQLGTGSDGDLTIETSRDLQAEGYARAWNVVSAGAADVTVDNVLPSLSPGDEVLLTTIWASTGTNSGNYEFKRVASISSGRIVFTEAIRNAYGSAAGYDGAQRTIVQRVPNFANLTITSAGTLSSTAPTAAAGAAPTGGTGIVAFRVKDTAKISGKIDMKNKGLPAFPTWSNTQTYAPGVEVLYNGNGWVATAATGNVGKTPGTDPAYWAAFTVPATTPALSRLQMGSSAAGNNGGIVYLAAGTLTFKDSAAGFAGATSVITTEGTSQGGLLWMQGGSFELNDPAAVTPFASTVTRFVNSAGGRLRYDYGQLDSSTGTLAVAPATGTNTNEPAGANCKYGGIKNVIAGPPAVTSYVCNAAPLFAGGVSYAGQAGAFLTQSLNLYEEPSASSLDIRVVDLLGVIGGSGASTIASPINNTRTLASLIPGLKIESSVDGATPGTWGDLKTGTYTFQFNDPTLATAGKKMKWRSSSATLDDKALNLRSVSFKLTLR